VTSILELPPLGPDAEVRARRKRFALGALGVTCFIAAAIGVPFALAGRDDGAAEARHARSRRAPPEREPEVVVAAPDPAATPEAAGTPDSAPAAGAPAAAPVAEAPATAAAGTARDADAGAPPVAMPPVPAGDDPRLLVRRGTVEGAGTLSGVLKRHGLGAAAAQELAEAFAGKFDVRRARPEDSYVLRVERATSGVTHPKLDSFTYRVSALEIYDVERRAGGELACRRRQIPVQRTRIAKGARVRTSLFDAASQVGLSAAMVGTIAEILGNEVDFFAHGRAGDTFRVVAEEERVEGRFQRYGPVQVVEYVGKRAGRHRAYRFGEGYYASTGRSVEREYLRSPLKFVRVTSAFNPRRFHPVLHRIRGHMGTDLAAPTGTPVYASRDGTIIVRGDLGSAGNTVEIQHADGIITIYAHLSRFEPGQSAGTRVRQRQVIGYVGTTGRSTGPHLHYAMKKGGRFVDPMNFEVRAGRPVAGGQMEAFRRAVGRLDRELDAIRVAGGP
jgi:murein DD-endopeptidase MepM/ murein hydrolase activator NlpD